MTGQRDCQERTTKMSERIFALNDRLHRIMELVNDIGKYWKDNPLHILDTIHINYLEGLGNPFGIDAEDVVAIENYKKLLKNNLTDEAYYKLLEYSDEISY